MQKNQNLFKAVTFLTVLLKSDMKNVYLQEGFVKQDMIRELKSLVCNSSIGSLSDNNIVDTMENSIDEVLARLSTESLIYYKDNRYYITSDGENVSYFMSSLSKNYYKETQTMLNLPYRFYPNSEQIYGIN
jgi:hypothetical protein